MNPGKSHCSELYSGLCGHPEGAESGNSCQLRKRVAWAVAWAVVLVTLMVAVVVLAVQVARGPPRFMPWCPDGWLGFQGKCYYFSDNEQDWNRSQSACSALGTALTTVDSVQELAFMMRYKGNAEHWIGLQKEQEKQWKWVNGTDFNSTLEIRGGGDCAYLNDQAVSSSRCTTSRKWVCSKPDAYSIQQSAGPRSQEQKNP